MKNIYIILVLFTLFNHSLRASFPVNKTNISKSEAQITSLVELKSVSRIKAPNLDLTSENELSPAVQRDDTIDIVLLLLLWFFLGFIAAHRWYAGRPAIWNILFILTLGFFLIGWVADGARILSGRFMKK